MPDVRRARSRTQKSREHGIAPGEVGQTASTRKAVRQSQVIVRLGTDSVNPFRQRDSRYVYSLGLLFLCSQRTPRIGN